MRVRLDDASRPLHVAIAGFALGRLPRGIDDHWRLPVRLTAQSATVRRAVTRLFLFAVFGLALAVAGG